MVGLNSTNACCMPAVAAVFEELREEKRGGIYSAETKMAQLFVRTAACASLFLSCFAVSDTGVLAVLS